METTDKIWSLIARVLNKEGSAKDKEELSELLHNNEDLRQQYDLLSRLWVEKQSEFDDIGSDIVHNNISRIISKAESGNTSTKTHFYKKGSRKKRIWLAAASVLIIISITGWNFIKNHSFRKNKKGEIIEARKGSRSRSLLPDGTIVWLNAGSKLSFDNDFSGATRDVILEGEAFFDVVKQNGKPFVVHISGIEIKVLGTAFNVKAYPEDKTVETTLYRGIVQVFRENDPVKIGIQLKPNEKLILNRQAAEAELNLPVEGKPTSKEAPASFTIAHIDSTKKENERYETAWLYSRLEFRGDSFEELAKKMERWYNITILFTDEKVKQLTLTGSFEPETLEQAFAALKEAFPITYKIKNHEVYVGSSE